MKRLAVAAAVAALVALASCREPTQIVVEARTNLAYQAGLTTSFTVGRDSETEGLPETTETGDAWGSDGFIGSLVVVPGSTDDGALSVKVVLGVGRDARTCVPPGYDGCIVARRRLRYSPHERLRLPVTLYAKCVGVPCDARSTCNRLGQCVDASVDLATCTSDGGCIIAGDPRSDDPGAIADGGSSDGRVLEDAFVPPDSGVRDASVDAAEGGTTSDGVDCGTGGICKAPDQCCLMDLGGFGSCFAASNFCPYRRIACDGRQQCPDGEVCCVTSTGTNCKPPSSCAPMPGGEVCHSTPPSMTPCYDLTKTCSSNGLAYGHYKVCR